MTICIAAVRQWEKESQIVLCCDDLVDHGDFGSTTTFDKTTLLGFTWFAMLSGHWVMANELTRTIRGKFQARRSPPKRDTALALVKQAVDEFLDSAFFDPTGICDLIVGGFVGKEPMLMTVGVRDGKQYVNVHADFIAVGSGALITDIILKQRNYRPNLSLREAVYMVYEAKRFSERAAGVGRDRTFLEVHYPNPDTTRKGEVNVRFIDKVEQFKELEKNYRKFGLQPINLKDQPHPQSPKVDPSRRKPLPGLPGETGEF